MGVPYDEVDDFGEIVVYPCTMQDSGSTAFVFVEEDGKFDRYETPMVDNCLTRRM
jgi:hypothetical protein